jgi:hypothetical protein
MCALAYWQLLLMRDLVEADRPAWHPRFREGKARELTPGLVQRAALRYLVKLGTPAKAPKVAGKGKGRQKATVQPQNTLSGDQKGQNRAKTGHC